ncbi:type III secretion system protein [Trinickia dinghuensis]|uniref:Type III secretion system protein n=1 Tax=Trinickia dinghuensis TaxID=2291023 RepID=A0A3D8JUJ2_9BURK|nr:type III secretion system protein [Trinickia dinghuensis]RDU96759.1 type III secretion system protein [Trinickia dinghuensis]
MKTLRILTGAHAGIQVRLEPGRYRIGKGDETDVCITDWDDDEVLVELDDAGGLRAWRNTGDAGRAEPPAEPRENEPTLDASVVLIPDLVPFPFGNTVLCFGADDVPWPPDIELLAGMYRGTREESAQQPAPGEARDALDAQRRQRRLRRAAAGILALGGVTLVASGLLGRPRAHANTLASSDPAQLAAQVNAALGAAHLPALHAAAHGALVEVDGFVANAAQDLAARGVLMKLDDARVVRRYDVEQTDLASLEESLGSDGVHVAWREPGVLSVTGEVASLSRLRNALDRVQTDLDSNVRRIEVDVTQSTNALPQTEYTSMMAAGGTLYVQTSDGIKHLFVDGAPTDGAPARLRETLVPARAPAQLADAKDPSPQQH